MCLGLSNLKKMVRKIKIRIIVNKPLKQKRNPWKALFIFLKFYELFLFLNRNIRITTTTIIATTIKIPKLIPALNISPIALHELTVKEVIIKVNIVINTELFPSLHWISRSFLIFPMSNLLNCDSTFRTQS